MCQGGGPLWLEWADWSCGAGGGGGFRKLTPRGWGGAKRGRKLPAVKFPGTRLRGSCWVVVRGWGPAWDSRWGDPGGEIVGRLGAQILGSCAGLLAALYEELYGAACRGARLAAGLACGVPWGLKGIRICRGDSEAHEGLHLELAASADHASCLGPSADAGMSSLPSDSG